MEPITLLATIGSGVAILASLFNLFSRYFRQLRELSYLERLTISLAYKIADAKKESDTLELKVRLLEHELGEKQKKMIVDDLKQILSTIEEKDPEIKYEITNEGISYQSANEGK